MLRYVALIWNPQQPLECAVARTVACRLQESSTNWGSALETAGLRVYCAGASPFHGEPILLSDGSGVVLGSLFSTQMTTQDTVSVHTLSDRDTATITSSDGRALMEQFWGRYVFFYVNRHGGGKRILRDPTGRMQCQFIRYDGTYLFFSCAQDVAQLGLVDFTINWPLIASQLISMLVEARETGLTQVSNVLAGECVNITDGRLDRRSYWHPARFLDAEPIKDVQCASRQLRHTLVNCAQAYARCHESILVRLSGGLDSSIVLASIQGMATRPQLTGLNFYSIGSDSDEREYARAAAARAQCELVELDRNPDIDLRAMLNSTLTAQPSHYPIRLELDSQEIEVIRARGVTAIFDGNGGDGILYQNPLIETAVDYLRDNRCGATLPRIALGIARTSNYSMWHVLNYALRRAYRRTEWDPMSDALSHASLVPPELKEPGYIRCYLHPWLEDLAGAGPARLWHVLNMSIPLNFEDQFAPINQPTEVLPIFSQPILELCLRIPTYVLAANGWDRGAARLAFSGLVPSEIIRRKSKGGREEHVTEIFHRNVDFIREMLLGGRLAAEGLLNVNAAERALYGTPAEVGTGMMELFMYLSVETWVRNWETHRSAMSAPSEKRRLA